MSHKWQKRKAKLTGFWNLAYSYATFRYSSWNRNHLQQKIRELNLKRLHLGCGTVLLKNWLNIQFDPREEYGTLKMKNGAWYLNFNLLKDWPIDPGTIDFIAASHFIEHLDLNNGIELVKKCHRALDKNGVLRLSCPDLERYARSYIQRSDDFLNHPKVREWCAFKQAQTPGEIFIAKAYDSGGSHKWFYDAESLKHILQLAGFTTVERKPRLGGLTPDLEQIELPDRELETVYVEGVKP